MKGFSGQILRGWRSAGVQCGMIAWGFWGGFGFSWIVSFQIGLPDFLGTGKAVALLGRGKGSMHIKYLKISYIV
ncbi:hypothetical protein PSCICL_05110 [Pseudomonas cichorii]|nr:hypothetical protein PSCICL_05110 [Pseudomonas cichorii]